MTVLKLACMSTHYDGAHCGLGDWYKEIEIGIQEALDKGTGHAWTTDWYSSKKEIASAKITHCDGEITIDVSVSDDFDTPGMGELSIPHTTDIEKVREAIYEAWQGAEDNQKDNRLYVGFSIHNNKGAWIETLIQPMGDGHCLDEPPGDCYHQWGIQGECEEIPETVQHQLVKWASGWGFDYQDDEHTIGDWTIKPWSD